MMIFIKRNILKTPRQSGVGLQGDEEWIPGRVDAPRQEGPPTAPDVLPHSHQHHPHKGG